jgi:hypothetical protein
MATKLAKHMATKKVHKKPASPQPPSHKSTKKDLTERHEGMTKEDRIIDFSKFDVKDLIASEVVTNSVTSTHPKTKKKKTIIYGYRLNIDVDHGDGTFGRCLLFLDEDVHSFGISTNYDEKTGDLTGHSMSFDVYDNEHPTDVENQFLDAIMDVYEWSCGILVEKQEDFQIEHDYESIRKSFPPPLYPRDKRKVDHSKKYLRIYPKLMEFRKKDDEGKGKGKKHRGESDSEDDDSDKFIINTQFYDYYDPDKALDYTKLLDRPGFGRPLISIDSIYVGTNGTISLQLRLREVSDWRPAASVMKRLTESRAPRKPEEEENCDKRITKLAPRKLVKKPPPKKNSGSDEEAKEVKKPRSRKPKRPLRVVKGSDDDDDSVVPDNTPLMSSDSDD